MIIELASWEFYVPWLSSNMLENAVWTKLFLDKWRGTTRSNGRTYMKNIFLGHSGKYLNYINTNVEIEEDL